MIKKYEVTTTLKDQFQVEAKARNFKLVLDQPADTGGSDSGANPMEYLLIALATCILHMGRIISMQQKINLRGMSVRIQGELDAEVLMGMNQEKRAGFSKLKAVVTLDADLSQQEKIAFLDEIHHRCPITDTIQNQTTLTYELA